MLSILQTVSDSILLINGWQATARGPDPECELTHPAHCGEQTGELVYLASCRFPSRQPSLIPAQAALRGRGTCMDVSLAVSVTEETLCSI